jgi:hypothetical protein
VERSNITGGGILKANVADAADGQLPSRHSRMRRTGDGVGFDDGDAHAGGGGDDSGGEGGKGADILRIKTSKSWRQAGSFHRNGSTVGFR